MSWWWIIPAILAILAITMSGLAVVFNRKPAATAPTPVTPTNATNWSKVYKNPIVVWLVALGFVLVAISFRYGGSSWIWIGISWPWILVLAATLAFPAFKKNYSGTFRMAIGVAIFLVAFWNVGSIAIGQIFAPKAEQVGIHAETLRDITVSMTSDPDHPLVVTPDQWSKRIWFNSNYEWTINAEGNRPFWLVCSGDPEQLHDPAKGKFAHVDSGRSCRIKSADGKPLKIYFRRK